jgi:hypothetical protein
MGQCGVEKVESFKFLAVHITGKLKWSTHTDSMAKALTNFYGCTNESILSGCITAWYSSCTALNRKALQMVVGKPVLQDTYSTRCHR